MTDLSRLRRAAADHHIAVEDARTNLSQLRHDLHQADSPRVAKVVAAKLIKAQERLTELIDATGLIDAVKLVDPVDALASIEATQPVAFLPIRLETRFRRAGRSWKLLVRIFPDVVHQDEHQPQLTQLELASAALYWAQQGSTEPAAWAQLVRTHGANRAAWIRTATIPAMGNPGAPAANAFGRGSRTTVLPDQFICVATRGGVEVARGIGKPVRDPLALSPDPTIAGDADGLDAATRWLVDHAKAGDVGMAITLDLGRQGQLGVDRLIAYGVKAALEPQQAAERLGALLDSHHYTSGLGLVSAGTPTNNSESGRSGLSSSDDSSATHSHRVEIERSAVVAVAGTTGVALADVAAAAMTDGARLAAALGVPASHFAHVDNAAATTDRDGQAMLVALWPGIGGYGIRQFFARSIDAEAEQSLHTHAVRWVRPRGPFPAMRVGRQPYGLLPVTSLARHVPDSEDGPAAPRILATIQRFAAVWATAAASTPNVGGSGDPAESMAQILALSPVSVGYRVRREADAQVLELLGQLSAADTKQRSTVATVHRQLTAAGLDGMRVDQLDGLASLVGFDTPAQLDRDLVQPQALSKIAPLVDNYITFLRNARALDVLENTGRMGGSLLYLLLRASVLSQYLDDSVKLAQLPQSRQELMDRFVVIDMPTAGQFGVLRDLLPKPVPGIGPGVPVGGSGRPPVGIGDLLDEIRGRVGGVPMVVKDGPLGGPGTVVDGGGRVVWPPRDLGTGRLPGFADFGARTGGRPVAGSGTAAGGGRFGVASAKPIFKPIFDAGSATGTLAALADRAAATDVGIVDVMAALAHLEGLPSAHLEQLMRETLDLGAHRLDAWVTSWATQRLSRMREAAPTGVHLGAYGWVHDLRPTPSSAVGGYLHAPSVAHAATAGLLRSAHLARGNGDELAIELSSARVRAARRVLDAVRAGQATGAVLGTLFEEHLLAAGEPAAIGPARIAAPLAGTIGAGSIPGGCDGELLLRAIEGGDTSAVELAAASGVPVNRRAAVRDAIIAAVAAVDDVADAMGDLLLAESVHQLAARNVPRATAAMAAASGGTPPDSYGVLDMAPSAVGVGHRLVVMHRGAIPKVTEPTARAVIDPFVEAWIATLLPPFASWVTLVHLDDGSTASITAGELGLAASDVVNLAGAAATPGGEAEPALVALMLGRLVAGLDPARSVVSVDTTAMAPGLAVARAIAASLTGARSFDPSDVPTTAGQKPATADIGEMTKRLQHAVGVVDKAALDATIVLEQFPARPDRVREALMGLLRAGVNTAIADPHTTEVALVEQLQRCTAVAAGRAAAAEAVLRRSANEPQDATTLVRLRQIGEILLGDKVLLTTRFKSPTLDACLDLPPTVDGRSAAADRRRSARQLLHEMATVRDPLANVRRLRHVIQATGSAAPAVDLLQITATPAKDDPWVGVGSSKRLAAGEPAVMGGRMGLLTLDPGLGSVGAAGDTIVGIVLDEWSETVPNGQIATAVAVHANRPSNEAPQAILLAVPPDPSAGWSQATIETILNETFELARLRSVDLPALGSLGQIVPMLHMPIAGLSFNKELQWRQLFR